MNSVELNRESELYLVFEAEFVPDQLEFFPAIVLAFEWSHIDLLCFTYCSTIWDLLVSHLRIGTCHFRSIIFVDSNRIPTAGTLNLSDSMPCYVIPLVYETVK